MTSELLDQLLDPAGRDIGQMAVGRGLDQRSTDINA